MSLIIKLRCMTHNLNCKLISQSFNLSESKNLLLKALRPVAVNNTKFLSNANNKLEPVGDVEEIHHGNLSGIIKKVKIFSLSTSAMTLLVQPYLIPKALESGGVGAATGIFITCGLFAFFTPLMLHIISGRYVTDICYDSKRNIYIASTWTMFLRKRKIEFTAEDVEKPGLAQILTTCFIKGKPLFFTVEDFTNVDHYTIIMGYDKPMDFRFEIPPQEIPESDTKIKVKKAN
ncbi:transmembrane protein 70 homolog, mitochondrial [Microplitis demolitor]|uniref:transmembrane protein 70 homolog, mitochondrial n=1 Tax=Microplitis demolitor TaxID=69319 RepID=UPI00044000F0|nr:transmembrane protein 70 homolog, mitochondrial [Microplitis demolitor]